MKFHITNRHKKTLIYTRYGTLVFLAIMIAFIFQPRGFDGDWLMALIGIGIFLILLIKNLHIGRKEATYLDMIKISVVDKELIYYLPTSEFKIFLSNISHLTIKRKKGVVRFIRLKTKNEGSNIIYGFNDMNKLAKLIQQKISEDTILKIKKPWFEFKKY